MDVDRYLRNTMDDADYAEATAELEKPYQRIAELLALLDAVIEEVEGPNDYWISDGLYTRIKAFKAAA